MNEEFNLESIDKTFTSYKKGQIFDGVVVLKREDGVIFNIGGKNDAFIPASDFDDFSLVKIGDRFPVIITKQKNEEGLIEASMRLARDIKIANQNAQSLRLGSKFTFVVTSVNNNGLHSKMGDYSVFVPASEASLKYVKDLKAFLHKQLEVVVTEIDHEKKTIIASAKLLQEQVKVALENNFWNSIFVNKIITGKIKKIMPYGAFVEVDGIDCFVHISNLSYDKVSDVHEVLHEGDVKQFRVINLDRENKKVELSYKALLEDPKISRVKELEIGKVYKGKVVKLLRFGAIVKVENGATGLLHIQNCTENRQKNIYELVKVDDEINVVVLSKDEDEGKVSFKLENMIG